MSWAELETLTGKGKTPKVCMHVVHNDQEATISSRQSMSWMESALRFRWELVISAIDWSRVDHALRTGLVDELFVPSTRISSSQTYVYGRASQQDRS